MLACAAVLLVAGVSQARSVRLQLVVVPISGFDRRTRAAAEQTTRRIVSRLREQHRLYPKLVRGQRRMARLRTCLQQPACTSGLSRHHRGSHLLSGYLTFVEGRYHLDLHLFSGRTGQIIDSAAVEARRRRTLYRRSAAAAGRLVARQPAPPPTKARKVEISVDLAELAEASSDVVVREHPPAPSDVQAPTKVDAESARVASAIDQALATLDAPREVDSESPDGLLAERPPGQRGTTAPAAPAASTSGRRVGAATAESTAGARGEVGVLARRYVPAWIGAASSLALLSVGVVLGTLAARGNAAAEEAVYQPAAQEHLERTRGLALGANLMFGLSGAAALASGVLFYLGHRAGAAEHASANAVRVAVGVAPGRGGVSLGGSF